MKRQGKFWVVLILVLVLVCGTMLAACDPPKEPEQPNVPSGPPDGGDGDTDPNEPEQPTASDMIKEIKEKTAGSNQFQVGDGKKFVTDFAISLSASDDKKYALVGKANVDVAANTQIYLALQEKLEGGNKTVFGLGYQDDETDPYLYLNVGTESGYEKVKGFSLKQLLAAVNVGGQGTGDGASSMIPNNVWDLMDLLATFNMLTAGEVSEDANTYTFGLHVDTILTTVDSLIQSGVIPNIPQEVKDVVAMVAAELTKVCADLSIDLQIQLNADQVATVDVKVVKAGSNFAAHLDQLRVDIGDPIADIFAQTGIDEAQAKEAINLLKFSVDGKVVGYNKTDLNTPNKYYSIDVDMDVNPFVLLDLIGNATGEGANDRIVAAIEKLGYFDVTVNEVSASGDFVKNIITLHSNTAEGKAVVALSTHKVMGQVSIGLGGVYELDELVDVIDLLVQKSQAAAGETPALADAAAGKSIGEILAQIMQTISIAQDGVTIQASDLVDALIAALMGGPNAQISGAVQDVFASDVLTISLQPVQYGQCTTKSIADIQTSIRTNSNSYGDEESRDLIGEITAIGLEGKQIAQNTTDFSSYLQKVENVEGIYKFTGKNLKGEEVTTSGYIYDVKGYDPAQIGKQTVTFRIAIANDFVGAWSTIKKFANLDIEIDPMIPLYGILTYTTEIEVVDASEVSAQASFVQGFADGTFTFTTGRDIANPNDGVFNFTIEGDEMPYVIVWQDGKLVVQNVLGTVNDKFTDINIILTADGSFAWAFPIAEGLTADPRSAVVGEGDVWGIWSTSGTIQFEMKYDGKKVVFDGMTNNTAKYVVA